MRNRLALAAVLGAILGTSFGLLIHPVSAQSAQPASAKTQGGFYAEEIRVGGSCVVIVSRSGSGTSDYLAVVPCNR